jgi:hypothetical protein
MFSFVNRAFPSCIFSRTNSRMPGSSASIYVSVLTILISCALAVCTPSATAKDAAAVIVKTLFERRVVPSHIFIPPTMRREWGWSCVQSIGPSRTPARGLYHGAQWLSLLIGERGLGKSCKDYGHR